MKIRPAFSRDPLVVTAAAFALVASVVLSFGLFIALLLPYGEWDAMSFGIWSRLIALHWPHLRFADIGAPDYHRPLFYVLQGWLWAAFGFHQWLGRLLSFGFSCVFVGSTAWIATRLVRTDRFFVAALAVLTVLVTAPFERYVAAGLSDVPAAAVVALTGAILVTPRLGRYRLPLLATGAALSVLAKPSSLGALLGLGLAVLIGPRADLRGRSAALTALATGTGLGLAYDAIQARYVHSGLAEFLLAGADTPFYQHQAATMRRATLLDGSWLGADLRLFLAFAVLYAIGRLVLPHRPAVSVSWTLAVAWSWLGPHLAGAHGIRVGVLGTGGGLEQASVIVLGLALLFALAAPAEAVPSRLTLVRGLVWAAPAFVSWAWKAVYDTRLLAPAWPALVLLIVLSVAPAFAGARALRPWLVTAPAAAAVVLGVYAVYGINGLGKPGWQLLRAGGIAGLGDASELRKIAVGGDFAAELNALAPQVGPSDRILTTDARLGFMYLDRIDVVQPQSCGDLIGHKIFVLLEADELQTVYGKKVTSPGFWEACSDPSLTLVGSRPGAFAVFVAGTPRPEPGGCGASSPPTGLLVQFGPTFPTRERAEVLLERVRGAGFSHARVDQLGCALYRVVYPDIPSRDVGEGMIAEARSANLQARLVQP